MSILDKFKIFFYVTLSVAIALLAGDLHNVLVETVKTLQQTRDTERAVSTEFKALSHSFASVPTTLDGLTVSLNSQLSKANGTLESAAGLLTVQTGMLQRDLHDNSIVLSTTLSSLDKTVSDQSIPLLLRDTRRTVSLIGTTAAPIRQMAERIDEATPALIASSVSVANSGAGIAKDVHKVADDFVKPKRWYQRLWSVTMDVAGFARFF